jgi:hypothetical protein
MPLVLDGTLGASAVQDNSVTDTALSLTANSAAIKVALNANNAAPIFACRAWVNFNGQGNVAIRASGNVSSVTDNGTGNYTVNFTTAMPDLNFCAVFGVSTTNPYEGVLSKTTSSYNLRTEGNSYTATDPTDINISIFR